MEQKKQNCLIPRKHDPIYRKILMSLPKKKPSRISEFIKFTTQKINIQKATLFLYTSNEQYKNETKKQLHLHNIKIRNKFNKSRARWLY